MTKKPLPHNPLSMRPSGMNVLVRRLPMETMTSSGNLALPETTKERHLFVELIAVGEGRFHQNGTFQPATNAKPGDIVCVRQYAGTRIPDWMCEASKDGKKGEYAVLNGQNIEGIRLKGVAWAADATPSR